MNLEALIGRKGELELDSSVLPISNYYEKRISEFAFTLSNEPNLKTWRNIFSPSKPEAKHVLQ